MWWNFISQMKIPKWVKIHYCDENKWLRRNFINLVRLIDYMKVHNSHQSLNDENCVWWWRFITVINIYHSNQVYQFDDMRSTHWPHQLCFTMSSLIWSFWYFPGWVGGGKIKNKDQLSQAEAWVEAELGKIQIPSI